jgi:hypothetical protein
MTQVADIETTWTPSFVLLRPITTAGEDWLFDHCACEPSDFVGGSLPVEHGCFADIALGAANDGLAVMDTDSGKFIAA